MTDLSIPFRQLSKKVPKKRDKSRIISPVEYRRGEVTAINPLTIKVAGSKGTVPNVRRMKSYWPVVGDNIVIEDRGGVLLVLGGIILSDDFVAPALAANWSNFDPPNRVSAGYMKDASGFTHLRGMVKRTTQVLGETMFAVPDSFTPILIERFIVDASVGVGVVDVYPNGGVVVQSGTVTTYVSLSGILWRAKG